jgi:Amt family ammonium transporter
VGTFILLKVIGIVLPLRASSDQESDGLDISMHGEEAYLNIEASSR